MDYPENFPAHAQARVSAAKVRAAKALADIARTSGNPGAAAIHYVMSIFAAFAHEACELGRQNIWTVTRIESEGDRFLYSLARTAQADCDEAGLHVWDMLSMHDLTSVVSSQLLRWKLSPRPIKSKILRSFKASPEWGEYQAELLEVAEIQGNPKSTGATEPASTEPRRSYNGEVRTWMKEHDVPTVEVAARRLGVGYSTLKSIMTDKGRPRYNIETLKSVLDKITHRTGD